MKKEYSQLKPYLLLWSTQSLSALGSGMTSYALVLGLFIRIPENGHSEGESERLLSSAREGLKWLRRNPLILHLILFLSCINLVASTYDAALPAMLLSKPNGGEAVLGIVNTCVGIATLAGSVFVTLLPAPKNRMRSICIARCWAGWRSPT